MKTVLALELFILLLPGSLLPSCVGSLTGAPQSVLCLQTLFPRLLGPRQHTLKRKPGLICQKLCEFIMSLLLLKLHFSVLFVELPSGANSNLKTLVTLLVATTNNNHTSRVIERKDSV